MLIVLLILVALAVVILGVLGWGVLQVSGGRRRPLATVESKRKRS